MVTITLHCPHCGSEARVARGLADTSVSSRSHSFGRVSCAFSSFNIVSPLSFYHAHPDVTFALTEKKELSFLLDGLPCSPPTQRMPRPRRWSPIGCGRSCSKKPTTAGFGWLSAERAGKWAPMLW